MWMLRASVNSMSHFLLSKPNLETLCVFHTTDSFDTPHYPSSLHLADVPHSFFNSASSPLKSLQMFCISPPVRLLVLPTCRGRILIKPSFRLFFYSKRSLTFLSCSNHPSSSSSSSSTSNNNDSIPNPKPTQLNEVYSGDLFGLEDDSEPRNVSFGAPEKRSWFGPNGQYIRELPCPSCRGRGYTPCTECGIERSRSDCSQCAGKGVTTCQQCLGECVIWEESIDEGPWEKARSISPFKVKEDDDVDNLDIKLHERRKSNRVYQSPSPEVGLKISRSLRSLNERTGLFSKHMKMLHRDPMRRALRAAAIKKAKQTPAARKRASESMKAYFSNPENRRKKSISMQGVKFYCSNCGKEGHRRTRCPELIKDAKLKVRCRLCGQIGHNRQTCPESRQVQAETGVRKWRCQVCGQLGHNRRTCPKGPIKVTYYRRCRLCGQMGHNQRTCQKPRPIKLTTGVTKRCKVCGQMGHNRRTCSKGAEVKPSEELLVSEGEN